jgi:chromosome segregation ATPase
MCKSSNQILNDVQAILDEKFKGMDKEKIEESILRNRELKELRGEYKLLEDFLEVSIQENLKFADIVEMYRVNNMALYSVIARLNKEAEELKEQLENHTKIINRFHGFDNDMLGQIDDLNFSNESLCRRLEKKDQVCESLKADVICHQHDKAVLTEDLRIVEEKLIQRESEIKIQDQDLKNFNDHMDMVYDYIDGLQEDIRSLKAEVVHYKLEGCNLQNEVDRLKVLLKIVDRVGE